MKKKLLCILHRTPPVHGASKVGDIIASSNTLKDNFDCRFITIKSAISIEDIGKVSLKKLYLVVELYIKVLWVLICFRPEKIYFTSSIKGVAFYRDLVISSLWKFYSYFKAVDIYYHYHTKGVDDFVSSKKINLILTNWFVKNVNLILLSPILAIDFDKVTSFSNLYYLPNGTEDMLDDIEFLNLTDIKFKNNQKVNVLYLSNMIKSKGYFDVLVLAKNTKKYNVHYHFAGNWELVGDKNEFYNFVTLNGLSDQVTYHGFVSGIKKQQLLKQAHLFVFPTRYKKEAFPLSILEALSYGLPVISTNEASIPYIINDSCGILIKDKNELQNALDNALASFNNKASSFCARKHYLDNFTLNKFEENFIKLLHKLG